jgi:hypothetical protein
MMLNLADHQKDFWGGTSVKRSFLQEKKQNSKDVCCLFITEEKEGVDLLVSRLHRKLAHGVVFQTVLHPS